LLLRHPIDCPICDKAGECSLQDYHFLHGREQRRADIKPFTSRRRELGDTVTLFVDRCVMCTRCVRFTREISGTAELMVTNRGTQEEIDVFPGFPLSNKLSGCVVDLCPVGALGDRDFLYKQRVWFMKSHQHVCANCSTGCSINVDENQDQIYRLKPRENPHINQWWMCDEGRYGWKHVHDSNRLTEPRKRISTGFVNVEWHALPAELNQRLSGKRLAVSLSPWLTTEEAWMLAKYARSIDANATIAVGFIPVEGTDERFPTGFTIHAEKCPNRRGVEEVVRHYMGDVLGWSEFLKGLESQGFDGVWITGGYKSDWIAPELISKFSGIETLIVQDCFESPLWSAATIQLPAATFAEREGSFVNYADRLQSFQWAIRPPEGVLLESHLYWRLLGLSGMYNASMVLAELAREVPYFSAAADGVSEHGIALKVPQLVTA
jgi:NADH-quinone oxidoreductase subunit G